jgi:carbon-monoxide dehydrogenase medium subunit
VAAVVSLSEDGTCSRARLAYCGAGPTAMAATEAAASLGGQRLDEAAFAAAAEIMQTEIDPTENVNASIGYQRHLAGVLTRRALGQALVRAMSA